MFTLSCTNKWIWGFLLDLDYMPYRICSFISSLVSIKDPIKCLLAKNRQTFSQKALSLMIRRVLTSIVVSFFLSRLRLCWSYFWVFCVVFNFLIETSKKHVYSSSLCKTLIISYIFAECVFVRFFITTIHFKYKGYFDAW